MFAFEKDFFLSYVWFAAKEFHTRTEETFRKWHWACIAISRSSAQFLNMLWWAMLVITAVHDNLFPAVSWKYLTIMFLQRRKVQVLSNLLEIETHHPVGPKSLLLPCITRTLILFWRSLVSPWIACYNAWNAQRRRFVQYIYNVIGHVRSFAQVTTVTFANSNPWLIEFMTTYGLFYIVCICFSARIRPKNMVHVDHRGLQKICRHCRCPQRPRRLREYPPPPCGVEWVQGIFPVAAWPKGRSGQSYFCAKARIVSRCARFKIMRKCRISRVLWLSAKFWSFPKYRRG